MTTAVETFEDQKDETPEGERLLVDVDGYEGPIDVLLTLAREQKVDLKKISILALVEQYLVFIQAARRVRLELAADYLVMAAWLAYLKSRLLLPDPPADDEPSGEQLAEALAFQLQRLEAMQQMAVKLMARPRLGRDTFPRGETIDVRVRKKTVFDVTLYELLSAYGEHKSREETQVLHIAPTELHAVEDAIKRLEAMVGRMVDWQSMNAFLPEALKPGGIVTRSAIAATLIASLELAKSGVIEIKQTEPFGPVFFRAAKPSSN
ncbi:MAG: segregation/condensation protein A [Rhodospirillaceae bacterium]|nr:segregation/condensation protein A [Rhodospirillaceae bacterium]